MIIFLLCIFWGASLAAQDILFDRPEDPQAWYNAGVAAFGEEQYSRAAAFFEEAKLRTPDTESALQHKALFNQGNAYAQAKEYQKALDIFRSLAEKNPHDATISKKCQYLEQLLKQPPESSEQKDDDTRDTKESGSQDDTSSSDNGEQEESSDDAAQKPNDRSASNKGEGQGNRQKQKEHCSENDSDEGNNKSDCRDNEKGGQEQQPEERADKTEKSESKHGSQSANQKNDRQSALNQRIAAYLDAVDAQGQEAFKADVQHACSGGGVHDKNW